jgi:hypothetical protein
MAQGLDVEQRRYPHPAAAEFDSRVPNGQQSPSGRSAVAAKMTMMPASNTSRAFPFR